MSTYRLFFTSVLSTSVTVEADDLGEAIDAAYDSDQMPSTICAQCSGWGSSWYVDDSGEWQFDEGGYELDGESVGPTE